MSTVPYIHAPLLYSYTEAEWSSGYEILAVMLAAGDGGRVAGTGRVLRPRHSVEPPLLLQWLRVVVLVLPPPLRPLDN